MSEDVSTLTRLGEFGLITAEVELKLDGSVAVIFIVTEQPLITEVQVLQVVAFRLELEIQLELEQGR